MEKQKNDIFFSGTLPLISFDMSCKCIHTQYLVHRRMTELGTQAHSPKKNKLKKARHLISVNIPFR